MRNILISGNPGVGKTTLVRRLFDRWAHLQPQGFYTAEIRLRGRRMGFELISPDGVRGLLAHVDIQSPFKVGKYRVDLVAFERFLKAIDWRRPSTGIIIIDEIGKMECLSRAFRQHVDEALDGPIPLVATIAAAGTGVIAQVKQRRDVRLLKMTRENRPGLPGVVERALSACGAGAAAGRDGRG